MLSPMVVSTSTIVVVTITISYALAIEFGMSGLLVVSDFHNDKNNNVFIKSARHT
jgi:hypothetical protein